MINSAPLSPNWAGAFSDQTSKGRSCRYAKISHRRHAPTTKRAELPRLLTSRQDFALQIDQAVQNWQYLVELHGGYRKVDTCDTKISVTL